MKKTILFSLTAAALVASTVMANSFVHVGQTVGVTDGDTIYVQQYTVADKNPSDMIKTEVIVSLGKWNNVTKACQVEITPVKQTPTPISVEELNSQTTTFDGKALEQQFGTTYSCVNFSIQNVTDPDHPIKAVDIFQLLMTGGHYTGSNPYSKTLQL